MRVGWLAVAVLAVCLPLSAGLNVYVLYPASNLPFGSQVYLRGNGCGLTWESEGAVLMTPQQQDKWGAELNCTGNAQPVLSFKALLQNEQWAVGANEQVSTVDSGSQEYTYTPFFFAESGDYVTFYGIYNKAMDNYRDVVVYRPPGFSENIYATYPVLIMHDGQNLFNDSTAFNGRSWRVAQTVDQQIFEGQMMPVVILGVDNTAQRMEEYTYSVDPEYGGGKGDIYLDFLEHTIIPTAKSWFPQRLRTSQPDLGILGSSLGGLISCYAGWTRPHVYSTVGCMSSSFWWNDFDFRGVLAGSPGANTSSAWIYLDSGSSGAKTCSERNVDDCQQTVEVYDTLLKKGFSDSRVTHYIDAGGQHNEYYWGRRFWAPMQALYAPRTASPVPARARKTWKR